MWQHITKWKKKWRTNSCMLIHYFRCFTNVNVPAGVSLRGASPGLRPHSRQRRAQSHSGGEAPERLPGNDTAVIQQVSLSPGHFCELFVNTHSRTLTNRTTPWTMSACWTSRTGRWWWRRPWSRTQRAPPTSSPANRTRSESVSENEAARPLPVSD